MDRRREIGGGLRTKKDGRRFFAGGSHAKRYLKGTEEKKKVKGWSTEEMKDKASSSLEEDEEMRTWKGLNQEQMDQCWKNLTERMEVEVLDKYEVEDSKREAYRG